MDITSFGAVGDGVSDCTNAIETAVAAVRSTRHKTVVVPKGVFLTRSFELASGITLQVDGTLRGATGDAVLKQWPQLPPLITYGRDRDGAKPSRYRALIFAAGVTDITIRGRGIIDGAGAWWWDRRKSLRAGRPHLLELYK